MRWILVLGLLTSCYKTSGSHGGGQVDEKTAERPRTPRAYDIAMAPGYKIELLARDLTFPTGIAFGDGGAIYVTESGYTTADVTSQPRILELDADGKLVREVATGEHAPWNGLDAHHGFIVVAQGGQDDGGRIVKIDTATGEERVLVDDLPSYGDHQTNAPLVVGEWVYFGQGTATNSGVVGDDSATMGWLADHPDFHDTPCEDVVLTGTSFWSPNPLTSSEDEVTTGPYLPFGTAAELGQKIRGEVPCNGAVMRVPLDGGDVELVAWGFRNPYGLAVAKDRTIYVTDNGYDVRGSRPVFGSADTLWELQEGAWYGFPDYSEGRSFELGLHDEAEGATQGHVLAQEPGTPPQPLARLPVHASADGVDISESDAFGHVGDFFIALFGDMAPSVGKVLSPVGFSVVRVDHETGRIEDFARNDDSSSGPATRQSNHGLERPIAVRFSPDGKSLYVVDFGVLRMDGSDPRPQPGTGVIWRITRDDETLRDDPEPARGEQLFYRHCHMCHPGGETGVGPALADKPILDVAVRQQIRKGVGAMPAFDSTLLSDEDVADIADYVVEHIR